MHTIEIHNFKAFGSESIVFGPEETNPVNTPKNILCYGDNGTGKTSVYEAIKWGFKHAKIIHDKVNPALVGEARTNAIHQIRRGYNNWKSNTDFSLLINGVDYESFNSMNYRVYMFNGTCLHVSSKINLNELYEDALYGEYDSDELLRPETIEVVLSEVNRVLSDVFIESIQVGLSQNGLYQLTLKDLKGGPDRDEDLHLYFNEAKIHLVKLLIILSAIEITAPSDALQHRLLVMDDIFSSLDNANRIFIFKYLAEHFTRFQIVLLTHNVSFFNLAEFLINNHYKTASKWAILSLYESNGQYKIYEYDQLTAKGIAERLRKNEKTEHQSGNDIRKYFEILLHQLSMLTMVDAKEEAKTILHDIKSGIENRKFYVSEHGVETAADLTAQIRNLIRDVPDRNLRLEKIENTMQAFENKATSNVLVPTLEAMTVFQKVALHKSSHGHEGLPDLSAKEIKSSLALLEELEALIDKINMERL